MVAEYCDEQGGFIIRTAAEGVGEAELASDAAYLKRVWTKVMERKKRPQTRYQLYGELALAQRAFCVISPTPNSTAFALTHA